MYSREEYEKEYPPQPTEPSAKKKEVPNEALAPKQEEKEDEGDLPF